jgi:hypothetical protein
MLDLEILLDHLALLLEPSLEGPIVGYEGHRFLPGRMEIAAARRLGRFFVSLL